MSLKIRERIFETSTTTGVGDFTTAGATQGGRRLNDVLSASDTFFYKIVDISGNTDPYDFETGIGTYLGSHVFERTAVIESSNSNNHVSFGSGQKHVFMELPGFVLQDMYQRSLLALMADENLHGLTSPSQARANMGVAYGKQSLLIPANAMMPRVTNGPSVGLAELTTNKNLLETLDFDAATQEFAQFCVPMPKQWNEGTVSFAAYWSHAATVTNFGVAWGLSAVAFSDDDAMDAAFGTAATVTDTGGTTNDLYKTAESGAITIGGSPAAEDYVMFRLHRDPANGSDTMAVDARLHAIKLFWTNDANTDD